MKGVMLIFFIIVICLSVNAYTVHDYNLSHTYMMIAIMILISIKTEKDSES